MDGANKRHQRAATKNLQTSDNNFGSANRRGALAVAMLLALPTTQRLSGIIGVRSGWRHAEPIAVDDGPQIPADLKALGRAMHGDAPRKPSMLELIFRPALERASGTPPAGSSTDADGSDAETVEETVEAELVELYRQQKLVALEEELRRLEED